MPKSTIGSMIKKAQLGLKKSNFKLLNNKYLLYIILFISISDLLLFLMAGDFAFAVIFILIGLITSFFSKNMIVILTSAMILTNVLKYGSNIRKEGMTEENTFKNVDLEGYYEQLSDKEKEQFTNIIEGNAEKPDDLTKEESDLFEGLLDVASKTENMTTKEGATGAKNKKSDKNKKGDKKKEGAKNKKETMKPKKHTGFKEYNTSTMPKKEGLSALETQTEGLIDSQTQLIENMNKLEPMLQQAESFMQNFQGLDKN